MPISDFLRALRGKIGNDLLLLPGVAAVIHNAAGEVLIQKREDDLFSLPAGAIEPGENPATAIVREVYEETGLRVRPRRLLGIFGGETYRVRYPNGDQVEFTIALFECEIESGELECKDGESKELKFFSVSEIPALAVDYPRHLFQRPSTAVHFDTESRTFGEL